MTGNSINDAIFTRNPSKIRTVVMTLQNNKGFAAGSLKVQEDICHNYLNISIDRNRDDGTAKSSKL
jgi:hypothetical protein